MVNNILVTGVSGELGTALVNRLNDNKNLKMIGVDIKKPAPDIEKKLYKFYKTDILNYKKLAKIVSGGKVRTIFHLAAILSTQAEQEPYLAHRVNVEATSFLLNLSHEHGKKIKTKIKFLFPSSIAVYNLPSKSKKDRNKNVREDKFLDPITVYGINKLYCENFGKYYTNNYKLLQSSVSRVDFRCIRFPGILSATTIPTGGTSDYAPEMLHHAAKGKAYQCFVRPKTQLAFISMPDAVKALVDLANANERKLKSVVYNVSGFTAKAKDIEKEIKDHFPKADISYSIDRRRQVIIDSWPKDVNDNSAKKDWNWKREHTFKRAFRNYLVPEIKEKYNIIDE